MSDNRPIGVFDSGLGGLTGIKDRENIVRPFISLTKDEINEYIKENNIPLIRIPYTKLNNLTIEDLKLPKPAQPTV